jgi:alpha-1,6-mannosyltransferase
MTRAEFIRFAVALALEIIFFAALNFFDDWTLESMPVKFVTTAFLSGAAYLSAVSNFRIDISLSKQALLFWSVTVVLRLLALPLVPGDDLFRNQWEGKVQCAGFNPYLISPADSKLDDLRHDFPQAAKINHPELRAIDPPGVEALFKFLSSIGGAAIVYKIVFAVADLCVAAVLLRLISGNDRYRVAAWYAWNPLAAYTFAGAARCDSLMMLAMVGGIVALVKSTSEEESVRKWLWAASAAVLFGMAISVNLIAVLVILPSIFALRWRAIALVLVALIPLLFTLPYGFANVAKSLGQIAQLPRLNDLFWWLVEAIWPNPHQRFFHYYPVLIICVIIVSFIFIRNWRRGMLWALGTALVLSPVLHPWYCVWILPIALWRKAYAWCVLSITIFCYYLFWDERLFVMTLPWHATPLMRELTIVPVLAAMLMLAVQRRAATQAA